MQVDIVKADFGYVAIYVDGVLDTWDDGDPLEMLVEAVEGKGEISKIELRSFGAYAGNALCFQEPPDRFEDIPETWWTDAPYDDEEDES